MTPELLDLMRKGLPPLPLTVGQARAQAYRLRTKHAIPYTVLARVMGEYHGVWKSEKCWRNICREQGAPVTRPNNVPPQLRRAAA